MLLPCNRYAPSPRDRIPNPFKNLPYSRGDYAPLIGPRQPGPYVTRDEIVVGQWGLIPWFAKEQVPKDSKDRPMTTNNARSETMAKLPTFRDSWAKGQRCLLRKLPATAS